MLPDDSVLPNKTVLPDDSALPKIGSQLARGFLMGAADVVPGVSGGTVALIFGIYEQLLEAIRTGARGLGCLAKGDVAGFVRRLKEVDWLFLVPLLVGILAAVAALSSVIERLLTDQPEAMAGLFFGLVLASISVAWGLLGTRGRDQMLIVAGVGILVAVLLGFQSGQVSSPPLWAFFLAGAIAICAMILPGVSGSFLLLMIGMYPAVLGAVHDRDLPALGLLVVGVVVGLALFSNFLGWLLDNYRDTVLAVLIGLMTGSLRVLWPWPNGVGVLSEEETIDGTGLEWPAMSDFWLPFGLAVAAAALVLGLTRYATYRENKP